jgi:hypothetical protein
VCSLVHLDVVMMAPLAASRRLMDAAGQGHHSEMPCDWLQRLGLVYLRPAIRWCREHGWGHWPDLVCRRMPHGIILTSFALRQSAGGGHVLDREVFVSFVYGNVIRGNTKRWANLARKLSVSARKGLERRLDWPDEIVPAYECGEAPLPLPPCPPVAPASSECPSLVNEEGTGSGACEDRGRLRERQMGVAAVE